MSPRPYNLGLRLQAAEQTRSRIIEAAREILSDDDFDGLSIDAIARRAGVARMTVYYQFTSRRGLLEALYDDLAARGLVTNLPLVKDEADPARALMNLIEVMSRFWAHDRLIIRRLRGLAVIDPEIEAGLRQRDEGRKHFMGSILGRLRDEAGWQSPMPHADATALLTTLASFETYDALAGECESPEATAKLLQLSVKAVLGLG